jgi:autotransporter-associated beta strand protein
VLVNLVKEGTGLLSLTGANSYSGGTQVAAGKVALDANTALGAGSATFAKDTELSLGVTKGLSVANAIEVDGEVDVHSGKFDSSLTGIISGAGSLVKDGTGQLSLTQDNTYSGGTQVAAGKVALDANAALGTGKATFAQNTELSLGVTQGVSVANAVQVDGAIKVHSGQFDSNLDGVVSGVGSLVKDGAGTLTLKGTNIYEGGTVVSDGTLAISQNANLGKAETGVTVSNATLLLNGDIAIERKVTLAGTTATLNTAQDTSSSLDDAVSGTAKLIKTGDGTLTLNTANSYAGGTQIAKGTLAISNDASLGAKAGKFGVDVVIDDAATLALTGNVAAARKLDLTGSTAIIDTAKNTSSSLSDVISGSAKLVKEGEGSLTLSGVNTYAGSTDINAGTLVISQDGNLGKAGTGVAINNATLSLNGSVAVDRTIALAGTTATVNTTTGSSSLVKEVSGSAALVKTGAGTLTLNSANSYTGDTQITGGTLAIDANDKLGTGTKVTISDATLALTDTVALNRTLDVTGIATVDTATGSNSSLDKTVNGSGQLVKTGAGTLELTQANSYTGGTAIKAGEIVLGANAALGTGAATFATDTELSFSQGLSVANAVQVDGKVQVHSGNFDSSLTWRSEWSQVAS